LELHRLTCVALCWFHPLVWIAYFAFRQDQGLSCDQVVLSCKRLSSRINYSKALLITAEHAPPLAFAQFSVNKYGDKQMMFERIKQIKISKQATKLGVVFVIATSVVMLSGLSYAGNFGADDAKKHRTPPKDLEALIPVYRAEPKYPIKAAIGRIEGSVVLKFDVDAEGNVENVVVVKGIPASVFDRVAITALKQWKYKRLSAIVKNNLVQLDFRMDENSTFENIDLIEKSK
jgi:bla regulator protein BlaR1